MNNHGDLDYWWKPGEDEEIVEGEDDDGGEWVSEPRPYWNGVPH